MTRSAVSSLTSPRVSALSARETVPGCTRAARATSRSVTEDDRTAAIMQTFAGPVGIGHCALWRPAPALGALRCVPGALPGHDLLIAAELPDRLVDLGGGVGDRSGRRAALHPEGLAGVGDLVELRALDRAERVVGGQDHPERPARDLVVLLRRQAHMAGGPLLKLGVGR